MLNDTNIIRRLAAGLTLAAVLACGAPAAALRAEPEDAPPAGEAAREGEPVVNAPSAVVIDANTGAVVYDKLKDQKNYPASVTKVMTALLTLEYALEGGANRMDERISFSREAVYTLPYGSSNIAMDEGETLTIEQALYALMLPSANEVANALAEHIGGTQEAFAKMMTERAQELGANNTHFTNAHGLHDELHYSTASDMAIIMREALKYPEFTRIIATEHYDLSPTERQPEQRPLNNSNKMIIPTSAYYNPYIVGGKTGFTNEAMHTLVSFGEKDGAGLIVAIMHGNEKGSPYTDTTALMEYCAGLYKNITLFKSDSFETEVPVVFERDGEKATAGRVRVTADRDLRVFLPEGLADGVTLSDDVPKELTDSVAAGDKVGTLTILYGGQPVGSVGLTAQDSVDIPPAQTAAAGGVLWGGELPFHLTWAKISIMAAMTVAACFASLLAVLSNLRRKSRRTKRYGLRRVKPVTYRYRDD